MQQVSAARESHRQTQRYLARKLLLTIYGAWFFALAVGTLHYAGTIFQFIFLIFAVTISDSLFLFTLTLLLNVHPSIHPAYVFQVMMK
jgi:hypothetical protein